MSSLSKISASCYASKEPQETLYERCLFSLGATLRDTFFLPLYNELSPEGQAQMAKEQRFVKEFWDVQKPLRPELLYHFEIRKHFACKTIKIPVSLGEEIIFVHCLVIESKDFCPNEKSYNFIHVLGNTSTLDNNITQPYSFLASYLEQKSPPPARFILISQYNIESSKPSASHKIRTLREGGFILSETLKSLEEKYGTIDQIFAHSFGCMITAASLKFFQKDFKEEKILPPPPFLIRKFKEIFAFFALCVEILFYPLTGKITKVDFKNPTTFKTTKVFKTLPKNIHFDRGPSSIEELSHKKWGGSFLIHLGRFCGWDLDLGKEIFEFIENTKENAPFITLSNALHDHYFNKTSSLIESPYIKKLQTEKKVISLGLDIVHQYADPISHHSLCIRKINRYHLIEQYNQDFFQGSESLSHAILRRSTPPKPSKNSEYDSPLCFLAF